MEKGAFLLCGITGWGLAWSVGFGPLGVQRLGSQGGARLQFSFRKLGQVGHDGVLIHVGIHNLLWCDDLEKDRKWKDSGTKEWRDIGRAGDL